jgi:SRSO17 transposase
VVVSAQYVADGPDSSTPLHWPVSAQVYLPESWATQPDRRTQGHIPDEVTFHTKPEIALALVDRARQWGVPFRLVVTDAGYGSNPAMLEGLAARHLLYLCGVEKSFGVRLPDEVRAAEAAPPPAYRGTGRPPSPRPAPLHTVGEIAQSMVDTAWRTITWREGTKGPLRKQFAATRVHWATGNPDNGRSVQHHTMRTGPEGWLLVERPLPGEDGEVKFYYSNLPADTTLERLVQVAHVRWVIEQFYEDAKGECGLDDYQGRLWDGLHRHIALVMLAYSFLVVQRLAAAKEREGGFSPLTAAANTPSRAPAGTTVATPGPRAMDHGQ